jgi:hypothetical protein
MQDKLLVLSEKQAITTSAASANYLNEGVVVNPAHTMIAEVRVTTTFTGTALSTLQIKIQGSADAAFTTPVDLVASPAVDIAKLKIGKSIQVPIPFVDDQTLIYTRAYYTVSATMSTGAVTTVIQPHVYTNTSNKA